MTSVQDRLDEEQIAALITKKAFDLAQNIMEAGRVEDEPLTRIKVYLNKWRIIKIRRRGL